LRPRSSGGAVSGAGVAFQARHAAVSAGLGQKDFGPGVTYAGGRANNGVVARIEGERSDGDLLGAVVARDAEAFAVFYRRYLPRVVGLLLRQTHDREVAADLAAEVFAAVLLSAGRFRGSGRDSAWPWVCGIAQNKLRESRRRGQVEDRARRRLCLEPEVLDDRDLERISASRSLGR
jgi:hypothetical protein